MQALSAPQAAPATIPAPSAGPATPTPAASAPAVSGPATTSAGSTTTVPTAAAPAPAAPAPAAPAPAARPTGTFTGSSVQTRFGPVQVSVTIANGTITEVTALQLTNDGGRSVAISAQAAPILRSEVLSAQSAKVSNVSGATYTTRGYLTSLQAALDTAGF
ncbi:FMN-binding protein [Cryobacterium sp. MDB1-18-2]|uniref:FMN-binding protein n=2 Tax=Microbacteriaceae TaxID=85023 RepID=A0ABY2IMT1_9MICO|nr:FMN-binding protein [Cryobacterium sp. MDB2-A-1]TFC08495.1 FMN-binding protein [Cryobacterium sp. MDB2-33-2]TFC08758.1 FMN-binding protein [Cryobacterium sp. MDB2-A-2]TFC20736.1 FMN-binding protein [Cryobacterium glucosi]TFC22367.1 FMN-binding protein [Cryobacterium sp. MDB2-10]TFC30213.1 FMN-binding protein [Cryobacterium sp. MDB1-18-2]TFC41707.1 FMN-binding protein [Cryobacterium sp. MDB1-18-1]